MTHFEARHQIAQKHHFENWLELKKHTPDLDNFDIYCTQAAELYARSKWDEGCEAQREECYHTFINHHTPESIWNAPKPEFKI